MSCPRSATRSDVRSANKVDTTKGVNSKHDCLFNVCGTARTARGYRGAGDVGGGVMATPGWYPDPSGGGGRRYWDGYRWTTSTTPPTQPPTSNTTLWIVLTAVIVPGVILGSCSLITASNNQKAAEKATATSRVPSGPSDQEIASLARAQINAQHASWQIYITNVTYRSGVLRVAMQIDRRNDKDLAETVAHAVVNAIRLGSSAELKREVHWVEVTDGTGVHIAQESVS